MNLLIIGGAGFIGKSLSSFACGNGHSVLAVDVVENAGLDKLNNYQYCRIGENDIPDCGSGSDSLVLLAAKRPYAEFSAEDYFNNIRLLERGMQTAVDMNIKKVVFASSKAVYSGDGMPWTESEYSVPSSLYGASKLACEQLGLFLAKQHSIRFTALRFAQVIGTGERKGYLINTLIDNALEGKQQVIYGSGEQKRHYVYIKDVCTAIVRAAEKGISGVFNIGMQNCITNLEMAECVNSIFGNEGNLRHDYLREMGAQNDEMSVEKAEKVLGFKAEYELKAVFEDIAGELMCD